MSENGSNHAQNPRQVRVDVRPDPRGPGWARLVLVGATMSDDTRSDEIRLSLQRNQDSRFLAEQMHWSASEVWHHPQDLALSETGVSLLLGPDLVDELLADPRTVCRVQVVAPGQSWAGVLRMGQGIYPSGAAGQSPAAARQAQAPVSELVQPPELASVVPPVSPPEEPSSDILPEKKSRKMPILLMLLLLAIAGLILAWYLGLLNHWLQDPAHDPTQDPQGSGEQTEPATSEPQPAVAVLPCSLAAMREQPDDLAFLQQCVQNQPDTAQVLSVIEAGKEAGRCDLIQRMYAHQAQAGNAEIAIAYAREFDPQTFKGGCFEQPDMETAIYWYETALQITPDQKASARVKQLKADLGANP